MLLCREIKKLTSVQLGKRKKGYDFGSLFSCCGFPFGKWQQQQQQNYWTRVLMSIKSTWRNLRCRTDERYGATTSKANISDFQIKWHTIKVNFVTNTNYERNIYSFWLALGLATNPNGFLFLHFLLFARSVTIWEWQANVTIIEIKNGYQREENCQAIFHFICCTRTGSKLDVCSRQFIKLASSGIDCL